MTEAQRPRSLELPVLVLTICVLATVLLLRLGSDPLITVEDVLLHGGFSFLLMVGGCFALHNATGVLARAQEWMMFLGVVGLGLGLEVFQHYVRIDSTVGDVTIDAIGATAGWAFWHVSIGILERARRRSA